MSDRSSSEITRRDIIMGAAEAQLAGRRHRASCDGSQAVAMHLAQTASQQRVLETRNVLRTARQALALTIDRAAVIVAARLMGDESAVSRERQISLALSAKLDTLVARVNDTPDQRDHAAALDEARMGEGRAGDGGRPGPPRSTSVYPMPRTCVRA